MNTFNIQNTFFMGCIALAFLLCSNPSNAQGWNTPSTVLENLEGGNYAQKLLVVNTRPAVAYYDAANFRLAYKRAGNPAGSIWPASSTVVDNNWRSGNNSIDMEIVNGNPAIVSDSPTGKDVRYTRANDASGTSWSTTVIAAENIATSYGGNLFLDLEVVNGRPAIAYYDGDNKDLYYVRANDANGTSWGTPVLLESAGDVGTHLSMKVLANGKPAICFYREDLGNLKYIRANDADGTTWSNSILIVSVGDVGKYADMELIKGNPAIVYYDATNEKVMYTRSTTSVGSLWWDGEYSVAYNVGATDLDLVMTDGKPGVAYRSATDGSPKFLISNSQYGWNWTPSMAVTIDDSANNTGHQLSAAVIIGRPAIIHRDISNNDILYTRSLNTNGLPVEMTYFKATAEEKTALLTWETASEQNNKGFHIEHSINGRDFETIGWVDGNGTSSDVNTYRFIDENPSSGMNYYRLLQEDFDGTPAYSEIEVLEFETKSEIKLFPNPTRTGIETSLQILSETSQDITINIIDTAGKIISSTQQYVEEGNQTLSIPSQMLGVGIYIISVTDNSGIQSIKLSVTE